MHFIRSQGASLNEAVGAHQNQIIAIQNPGYINIQFSRIVLPTIEQVQAQPYQYRWIELAHRVERTIHLNACRWFRPPHNVACGFPALRCSVLGSQHS